MRKDILNSYIGKMVTIKLFDGEIITGELHKTGEEIFKYNPNLYVPRGYYTLINPECYQIFKSTHVNKIEVVE